MENTGTDTKQPSKLTKFPEGSVILSEGEVNLDMYKIVKGFAEVYMGYGTENEVIVGIIDEGSCFGEFGLLLKKPSIYTVVAFSDVYALRVTEGEMGDFVQNNHKYIIDIMKNMAENMEVMHMQIELLMKEINEGKKADDETHKDAERMIRGYAMYNPNAAMQGRMRQFYQEGSKFTRRK